MAVRALVHTLIDYDGKLDVEEYIDAGISKLAAESDGIREKQLLVDSFKLLREAAGADALRRFQDGRHIGKVSLVGLESIAVGVTTNLNAIIDLPDPSSFVNDRLRQFWQQPRAENLTSPGLRGTTRIQRTIPFGKEWFRP